MHSGNVQILDTNNHTRYGGLTDLGLMSSMKDVLGVWGLAQFTRQELDPFYCIYGGTGKVRY